MRTPKVKPATPALSTPPAHGSQPRHVAQPLHVAQVADALLKLATVRDLAGLSTSSIYRKAASDPTFPRLIKMGTRCTRIRAGDLLDWLKSQGAV